MAEATLIQCPVCRATNRVPVDQMARGKKARDGRDVDRIVGVPPHVRDRDAARAHPGAGRIGRTALMKSPTTRPAHARTAGPRRAPGMESRALVI
jgi:hypothetical protein